MRDKIMRSFSCWGEIPTHIDDDDERWHERFIYDDPDLLKLFGLQQGVSPDELLVVAHAWRTRDLKRIAYLEEEWARQDEALRVSHDNQKVLREGNDLLHQLLESSLRYSKKAVTDRDKYKRLFTVASEALGRLRKAYLLLTAKMNRMVEPKDNEKCPDWLRNALLIYADYRCLICDSKENLQIDRVYPGQERGRYILMNCGPLCDKCNASKKDSLELKWRDRLFREENRSFWEKCERLYLKQRRQMSFPFDDGNGTARGIG
jgi:5-methylcytosine-specific restriction endonuclease McrA